MYNYYSSNDKVQSFQNGKNSGFEYFFKKLYKPAFFFAWRFVKDKPTAEDIVSTSFIKLWNKRNIFDTEAGIKAYLYKTVYNACIRHSEQKQNWVLHSKKYLNLTDTTQQPCIQNIIYAETIHLLHQAITHLPVQCRKVFTKLYIEGKSVSATALEMNLSPSAVKNQKARGLKLLKAKVTQ